MEYLLIVLNWFPDDAGRWLQSLSGWHILIGAAVIVVVAGLAVRMGR